MSPSIKNLLVIIGALVVGGMMVYGLEYLIHQIFPSAINISNTTEDSFKTNLLKVNDGILSLLLLAHCLGSLASGCVIGLIGTNNKNFLALISGLILTLSGLVNLVVLHHPIWYSIADTCIYIPMTILGLKLFQRTKKQT